MKLDAYPLHHPLRARAQQRLSQSQTLRGSTGNFMADTAVVRETDRGKGGLCVQLVFIF
jgi:hypothetical protein